MAAASGGWSDTSSMPIPPASGTGFRTRADPGSAPCHRG